MYSNKILNFQESTTILNTFSKKVWKPIECTTQLWIKPWKETTTNTVHVNVIPFHLGMKTLTGGYAIKINRSINKSPLIRNAYSKHFTKIYSEWDKASHISKSQHKNIHWIFKFWRKLFLRVCVHNRVCVCVCVCVCARSREVVEIEIIWTEFKSWIMVFAIIGKGMNPTISPPTSNNRTELCSLTLRIDFVVEDKGKYDFKNWSTSQNRVDLGVIAMKRYSTLSRN